MNRRDLIRHGASALFGISGVVLGVKAASDSPPDRAITLNIWQENNRIVEAVTADYERGGKLRQAIQRDGFVRMTFGG